MMTFTQESNSNINCKVDINALYSENKIEIEAFWKRFDEFLLSDEFLPKVIAVDGKVISYPHKSWIPEKFDDRKPILMLFGNPASHSVFYDIYFSYEGKNREHRFWKVLRELGILNINTDNIKEDFLNLNYESNYRFAFDVIYTFPSSASDKKWSGVAGLEKLFGKKAMFRINEFELARVLKTSKNFFGKGSNGKIIALQKNAFNLITNGEYNVNKALKGELKGNFQEIPVIGIPPTRWLYTKKMKNCLSNIF